MRHAGSDQAAPQAPGREELRQRLQARIRHLERASGSGLWAMVLFLLVSLAAFDGFAILPDLDEGVRRLLGAPPPATMISLALVIYAFSAIVRTLARMSRNIRPYRGMLHAAFFTAFYAFYQLSGVLPENFWAVFFAGMSVMGLESYYLWAHSSAELRRERALLDSMGSDGGGVER